VMLAPAERARQYIPQAVGDQPQFEGLYSPSRPLLTDT
jgi:hypothetical protein